MYSTEHHKKLTNLYNELEKLKEAKKVIQDAIHYNFYNKTVTHGLYDRIETINKKIKFVRAQIEQETKNE